MILQMATVKKKIKQMAAVSLSVGKSQLHYTRLRQPFKYVDLLWRKCPNEVHACSRKIVQTLL